MNKILDPNAAEPRIVYVRSVAINSLPADLRERIGESDEVVSVHDASGQQLALVASKTLAFALAREHGFSPVSVH